MKNSFDEKILEEANDWIKANQTVVLATVIQTWGSSPRQVGSRMIVNDKGDFSGSVSGGCVETAVVRECTGLLKENKPFKKIKIKVSNENAWETTNESLSDTVRILYEESIDFSIQLESDYIFQHDVKLTYNDILVLRTENYLILGNIEEAILSFNQIDFDQLGFEVNEACEQGVDFDSSKLIECLCIVSHNGFCPFGDLND